MKKLIAVGMRYQNVSNVKGAINAFEDNDRKLPVKLVLEDNPNGLNGQSVAVYHNGFRVAYIRNQDLERYFKEHPRYENTGTVYEVYTNYWAIEPNNDLSIRGLEREIVAEEQKLAKELNEQGKYKQEYKALYTDESIKKETKMNISSSMRDSFFREIKDVAIDLQSGKMGVMSADGISVYVGGSISVNPISDFGIKIPAFAMRVAINDLREGDIIVNGKEYSFFRSANETGGYEVIGLNGEVKLIDSVNNMFFGKNSVLAIKNMFGEGTNPMLMAMMMSGDEGKGFDMKTFALMSMMGGMGGDSQNPMSNQMLMMMAFMGK